MVENITNLRISMVTSGDPRFPAENMLDGTTKTFWASTGLFPQEFIVSLPAYYVIKKVTIWSMKVAGWTVSRSTGDAPFDFDEMYREDIEDAGDQNLQVTSFSISSSDAKREYSAKNVKFTIRKGHSDFTAVHRVAITGEIDSSRESERKSKKERERVDVEEDELSVGRAVRVN
ncbi:Heat shock protein beta-11 [Chytriomyces hyalinus]|nr:Heat shock protein beta-11 [Chytriomyces hyalinus]